ncbi:MAG: amidohydrolase family protein [Planctomycetes bacterium]|nr:amidohydrolase family protein [Planctomycetota bacterium]
MADSRTFTARCVFPVTGPPLPNGTVTVQGNTITAVEAHGVRAADEDLGNVAIIPGLVNAHTHLDLSGARGQIPPTSADQFTDWLRGVIAFRKDCTQLQVKAHIRFGLAECLNAGTTLLGDISSDGASWDAVAAAKTRAVVFHEVLGLSSQRFQHSAATAVRWICNGHPGTATCSPGVSPHAPYSVCADRLPSLTAALPLLGNRITVHLAETKAELELLTKFSGPFVEFLTELGAWDPSGLALGPTQILDATRAAKHALYAHCNYLPPETAFAPNQSVAYCPRTHTAFGHSPHPFREFMKRGVRVCLGTDSLASNPDLDILAEARFVHASYPDFPGDQLLRMLTIAGAEALGWGSETGSLEVGKSADLVAVPLPDREAADSHELLFADHPGERRTMFRGEWRD